MAEISFKQNIFLQWIIFHFFDAPREILKGWRNFLVFNMNYFSVPILLKTLFSYWRRYRWYYPRGLDIGGFLSTYFSNGISRVLGAIVRIILIIIGAFIEIFILIAGVIVFAAWIFAPFAAIYGIFWGIKTIF